MRRHWVLGYVRIGTMEDAPNGRPGSREALLRRCHAVRGASRLVHHAGGGRAWRTIVFTLKLRAGNGSQSSTEARRLTLGLRRIRSNLIRVDVRWKRSLTRDWRHGHVSAL